MQRIKEIFSVCVKFFQQKFSSKRKIPHLILFRDFFPAEIFLSFYGFQLLKTNEPTAKWKTAHFYVLTIMLVLLSALLSQSAIIGIRQLKNGTTLFDILENILILGIAITALVKFYVIFYQKKSKILEVIEKLDSHFPHSSIDQRIYKTHHYWRVLSLFSKLFLKTATLCEIYVVLLPLLRQIYGAFYSDYVELEPIFAIQMPFDQKQHIVYEIIFAFEAWQIFCAATLYALTDITVISLIQILSMEFDILRRVISEIDVEDNEEEALKKLKILIDIHQELMDASEKVNDAVSIPLFINVSASIMTLCTAAFLVVVIIRI